MRKRVVAILTWPLRFLRRLLGLLSRPFRKLRSLATPLRKLRGLKGKPRIAAFVLLGVVVVVVVLSVRPGPNQEKEVRATLAQYATATREKDYQKLCDSLLSSELVKGIRNAGLPCEVALKTGLDQRRNPQLTVLGVEVSGDQALASVRGTAIGEVAATTTYRLVREDGGWKIATSPGDSTAPAPGTAAGS
jgi:hypothetical protein